jgi:mono/diheme cytochrome c family protein
MNNTRVQIEITLGIILIAATATILIIIGLNEENRMQRFAMAQSAQSIEVGAELYEINCSTCHGLRGEGIPGLCPPLNDEYFFNERLADIGWSGTQTDFIISTISSGRVVSTRPDQYFGGGRPAMPAWSEHYGGPLRDDQIQVIAAFIMNWEATAGEVVAQPTLPDEPVGEDITIQLPEGNPSRGEGPGQLRRLCSLPYQHTHRTGLGRDCDRAGHRRARCFTHPRAGLHRGRHYSGTVPVRIDRAAQYTCSRGFCPHHAEYLLSNPYRTRCSGYDRVSHDSI